MQYPCSVAATWLAPQPIPESLLEVPGSTRDDEDENDAFVGDRGDVRNWPVLDPLVPHARAVVAYADEAGMVRPAARLMNQIGGLPLNKAQYAEAEPLMCRAPTISLANFGFEHPTLQAIGDNYIRLSKTMGKTDDDIRLELAAVLQNR